ncbi:MAG: hypothetical protein GY774_39180 [Planctomycetes bacterium]|nr:hypothetical protein [Planctomycetota bacterium]
MFTEREKYLMMAAFESGSTYPDFDTWINTEILDSGFTIGGNLDYEANAYASWLAIHKET